MNDAIDLVRNPRTGRYEVAKPKRKEPPFDWVRFWIGFGLALLLFSSCSGT